MKRYTAVKLCGKMGGARTMTQDEITLDELRMMARRAGLELADDELRRLLPGVNRAKKQAAELRQFIAAETEPAGTFNASDTDRK